MKLPEIPKKPFKNLEDFVSKICWNKPKHIPFPCFECEGKGRIYDPDDPPDVIEGYKLVRRITCPKCKGSGEGYKEEWNKQYKVAIVEWKLKKQDVLKRRELVKSAIKKLTKEEIEALKLCMYY